MVKPEGTKVQSLAFTPGHLTGPGCAVYVTVDKEVSLLTCGADQKVVLRDCSLQEKANLGLPHKGHAIAVNPHTAQAVIAHERFAKIIQIAGMSMDMDSPPGGRAQLPIRALACSPDGKQWVFGGDNSGVKMCSFSDGTVTRQLHAEGYLRGLAWDPAGQYIAGAQADGGLLIWDRNNSKPEWRRSILRKLPLNGSTPLGISWHPDGGSLLAVPGTDNDVVLHERLSWKPSDYLTGGHNAPVVSVTYSPNGLYLASADEQGTVCVWDATSHQVLTRATPGGAPPAANPKPDAAAATGADGSGGAAAEGSQNCVVSLSWHPTGNSLVVMNAGGQLCVWAGCVPASLPGPAVPVEELHKLDIDDQDAAGAQAQGSGEDGAHDMLDDAEDDGEEEEGPGAQQEDDDTHSLNDFIVRETGGQAGRAAAGRLPVGRAPVAPPRPAPPRELPCQKAFQPCSTPAQGDNAHFLAYTRMGCITSRPMDDSYSIEVTFHDTQRLMAIGGRVPPIKDYFGFTHGCLGERGVLLGSPAKQDQASMILYKPFESWAANSDWQFGLPEGESVTCLAAGASFSAAATSSQLLRLFSPAGLQLGIITLPGAPVAMVAQGHNLAVVTVVGSPSHTIRAQNLWITVYDMETQSCSLSCACPLTSPKQLPGPKPKASADAPALPVTCLTWLGFSDKGAVAVGDSTGMVQLRSPTWGGCWVPVYRAWDHVKSGETYWPVAVHGSELLTIMLQPPQQHPQVSPAPYLTPLPLSQPVLHKGDTAEEQLDAGLLMANLMMEQARSSCHAAGSGTVLQTALSAAERGADQLVIKVMNAAIKAGRYARAHDAANCLQLTASLEGALRLANHFKATALAERLAAMIQSRLEEEEMLAAAEEDAYQGLTNATMTPIPMKGGGTSSLGGRGDAALHDNSNQDPAARGNASEGQRAGGSEAGAPGSTGPPSTGGAGGLTALKKAAMAAASPAVHGQENQQKRKTAPAAPAAPLNNPFARRPTKQAKI